MKKLLAIVVLGLLWCNISFALTQESAVNQFLSGRKLVNIEGIWLTHYGAVWGVAKSGSTYNILSTYNIFVISGRYFQSGERLGSLTKGSSNTFYGNQLWPLKEGGSKNTSVTYTVSGNAVYINADNSLGSFNRTFRRLWPESISAHNAKFEKPKKKRIKNRFIK